MPCIHRRCCCCYDVIAAITSLHYAPWCFFAVQSPNFLTSFVNTTRSELFPFAKTICVNVFYERKRRTVAARTRTNSATILERVAEMVVAQTSAYHTSRPDTFSSAATPPVTSEKWCRDVKMITSINTVSLHHPRSASKTVSGKR